MMTSNKIKELLDRIEKDVTEVRQLLTSDTNPDKMSLDDLVNYDPLKRSKWFFYNNMKNIPHHKDGNRLYFKLHEINNWLMKK